MLLHKVKEEQIKLCNNNRKILNILLTELWKKQFNLPMRLERMLVKLALR